MNKPAFDLLIEEGSVDRIASQSFKTGKSKKARQSTLCQSLRRAL